MELGGVTIKPVKGMLALRVIDDDVDDDGPVPSGASNPPSVAEDSYNEAVLALVLGVGDGVPGIKAGMSVFVRGYAARNGVRIDDDVVLVDSYAVVATVTAPKS